MDSTVQPAGPGAGAGGFSALLEAAVDAVIIITGDGVIRGFNGAATRLFQYRPEDIIGANVSRLMSPPDAAAHDAHIERYLATGMPRILGTGRRVEAQKKDGTVFPIELSVGEYTATGDRYFIGILRDLTDQERDRAALTASGERLRITVNEAPIGIITLAADGRIASANRAVCVMTGHPEAALVGRDGRELADPDDADALAEHVRRQLAGEPVPRVLAVRIRTRVGAPRSADLYSSPVRAGSGAPGLIVQLIDRTEQVRAEQNARDFRERLAKMDRISTMGEMASGIAHELNQPLAAISSYAEACRRQLSVPDADLGKCRELVDKANAQARRAGDVLHRVRALLKPNEQVHERVAWNPVVADTVELAWFDARSRGIAFDLDLAPEAWEVTVDVIQLQQVILNLIRNAIDATEEAGIANDRIRIGTRPGRRPGWVETWVQDRGAGVAPGAAGKLFEPFFTTKQHGIGTGLSISRTIVDAHGGRLRTRRREPYTEFSFTLPVAADHA